ncbi:MAG: RNA-binding protein [Candidatus Cloacimonadales bacterium]
MNIYVGNLSYQMTDEALQELFEQFGAVTRVNVIKDRETGRSKGFGFVEMEDEAAGDKAIEALDGEESNGRNLRVNKARPREDRPQRKSW